jgi:hypothetical protein
MGLAHEMGDIKLLKFTARRPIFGAKYLIINILIGFLGNNSVSISHRKKMPEISYI